jgi:transposase
MARSRRTKIAPEDKLRVVLSVLAGEMSCREAARRLGVCADSVVKWKHQFLEAGAQRLHEIPSGAPGRKGTPEQRRLQMENEQLKLALAEATVQLRIWQRGAVLADQVPSLTSKP